MIEYIDVVINGRKYKYNKDITLIEISKEFASDFKYPILLAKDNYRLRELNHNLKSNTQIEFLDLTSPEGNITHVNGLVYIMLYAVKKLYGKKADINVQHSLDKGIYIVTSFKLDAKKVDEIKRKMQEIIESDKPITRLTIDRLEAIDYFESIGDNTKADTMRYITDNYTTLYRLGNLYNYFYNLMPISTGQVKAFDLTYIQDNGLILQFPTVYLNNKIKKYEHHPNMFDIFREYRDWAKIMNIKTSVDLNKFVSIGKSNDLIKIDETLQSARLLKVAHDINYQKNKIRIVLIAGPSSSGKTTLSKKLCMHLECFGLHPKVLSMDDYFLDKRKTPRNEEGKKDFDSIDAIDLELFDEQLDKLLNNEVVNIPTYNFYIGKKEYKKSLQLGEKDIIVIEGIHALNDKILTNIKRDKKFKIYVSPLTQLNVDNHNRIFTTDNRLLRRIIRDNRTRGHSVEDTLAGWQDVRKGEEKYIFPFQDDADATVNTAAIYEMGVLKTYVEPLLYSVNNTSPYYEEAKRLINFLKMFLPIPSDSIPEDSIIREFIGKSYFEDK